MVIDEKFWLAICFVLFILLTYKPIKKAILGMLDGEIARIRKDLAAAEAARSEAENDFKELEQELARIRSQRNHLLSKAEKEASETIEEYKIELENTIKLRERDAATSLEQLGANAASEVRASLIQAAKELAEEYATKHRAELPSDAKLAERSLE
jgi:F-type H+-transporting ATPase subunit b